MSENKKNQKKEEEGGFAPDICGSLREGTLAKEKIDILRNSSGLTPLGPGVDVCKSILNRGQFIEGSSTIEDIEKLKRSSGLSPLRPFGERKEVLE